MKMIFKRFTVIVLICLCRGYSVAETIDTEEGARPRIDLSGQWRFALDPETKGIDEKWYLRKLEDTIMLPGTTDENQKGQYNADKSQKQRLTRHYPYIGVAWYQKHVAIPTLFKNKHIMLILERTKETMVWVDGVYVGHNNHLSVPHRYDLTDVLRPGGHTLTVMVNNGLVSMNSLATVPFKLRISHALSENIQTNWNGIIGDIDIEASPNVRLGRLEIFPDCDKKDVKIVCDIHCDVADPGNGRIEITANAWNSERADRVAPVLVPVTLRQGLNTVECRYPMGENPLLWSEFSPSLYTLRVILRAGVVTDSLEKNFGMRQFQARGSQFAINGKTTFLRGRHDAGLFPLTGHPPMDCPSWIRVFRISKSYGLNHHRFHSWTPPRAAFEAADIMGIYLQPELPVWSTIRTDDTPPMNEYLCREGVAITQEFGNHASFVMMSNGNEMAGDSDILTSWFNTFKTQDAARRLYSMGSNNYLGTQGYIAGDFLTTCRTARSVDTSFRTNVRLAFNYIDEYEGGIINALSPKTNRTYAAAISAIPVPVVSHEAGQFQIYPDYREIPKFNGVLRPDNLELFKQEIIKQNMQDQIDDFHLASGRFAALCYREEIETALRTEGFGGFRLLDLQDFTGQGTALVGVIDAFMDSKCFITPQEFSRFCGPVVPLAMFEKFCWTNCETFTADVVVPNYSASHLPQSIIRWSLRVEDGDCVVSDGTFVGDLIQGQLNRVGTVCEDLSSVPNASVLTLNLAIKDTPYVNDYRVWVYPNIPSLSPTGITVHTNIDDALFDMFSEGQIVLLFPDHEQVKAKSIGGQFSPDFWHFNPTVRKGSYDYSVSEGTLSLLADPKHPLFRNFPTDMHTNWQWWSIIRNARPYILDTLNPVAYKPIVQMVDNIERNHRLGLIFEFAVGKGKVLVCMSNLPSIIDRPEAKQLYRAILLYMQSLQFHPTTYMSVSEFKSLFKNSSVQSSSAP